MKLSQKQASILATEIRQRIIDSDSTTISDTLRSKIEKFKQERDVLIEKKDKAEEAIETHDKKLTAIVGKDNLKKIRKYWDVDNIIEELEKANIPTIEAIENRIILKAMFVSAEEMDKFVNDLVKEFTKKKKVTN